MKIFSKSVKYGSYLLCCLFLFSGFNSLGQGNNLQNDLPASGFGNITRDQAEQQLSSGGLQFSYIGEINGLPTLVAPGEGSSFQIQGPNDKLVALTIRWNGRFAKMNDIKTEVIALLEPIVPQVDDSFFSLLERNQQIDFQGENLTIAGKYRKLGNQVSWEINARLGENEDADLDQNN